MQKVVHEAEDYSTIFDVKALLEAQYPGARISDVMRIDSPAPPQNRPAQFIQSRNSSSPGRGSNDNGLFDLLIQLSFFLVRFAPLLALYGAIGYWEWGASATWHPVYRGLMMLGSLIVITLILTALFARIPRAVLASIGALTYFGAALYAKELALYPPKIDWTWAGAIAVVAGLVGWWSFASCHDALLRIATHVASRGSSSQEAFEEEAAESELTVES